jgi:hypothetical protein
MDGVTRLSEDSPEIVRLRAATSAMNAADAELEQALTLVDVWAARAVATRREFDEAFAMLERALLGGLGEVADS